MNHEHEQSHASSTAAATAKTATAADVAAGRVSRSAGLDKPDHPIASGLTKTFTPPKRGVATDTVYLRGLPKIGPTSAKLGKIPGGEWIQVTSEVKTPDREYPT